MVIDIVGKHSKALSKIRQLFPNYLKVEYVNGAVAINIPCTVSREKIENVEYNSFIGRNTVIFNVLVEDLKNNDLPLKGFSRITHNRVEYMVDKIITNALNNSIHLYCKIYKKGNN